MAIKKRAIERDRVVVRYERSSVNLIAHCNHPDSELKSYGVMLDKEGVAKLVVDLTEALAHWGEH